ncbi:MAG: helix-turn-helix domain-containing protein [Acetobacter sp.]|nr:helix-turn-helix domain-containing protein [Acetobacter sp.]
MYISIHSRSGRYRVKEDGKYGETIGERLKLCREFEGFSVEDVAHYLHRSPKIVIKYENDAKDIPFKDLALLSLLYLRCMDFFCRPFYKKIIAGGGGAAPLLLKYAKYSNTFYFSDMYFPEKNEYKAIVTTLGYDLCPMHPIFF